MCDNIRNGPNRVEKEDIRLWVLRRGRERASVVLRTAWRERHHITQAICCSLSYTHAISSVNLGGISITTSSLFL